MITNIKSVSCGVFKLMDYNELQIKITELERENAYLKTLLDNAGISYTTNKPDEQSSQEIYDENQGRRIIPVQITHNHVRAFFLISGDVWMFSVKGIRTSQQEKQAILLSAIISGGTGFVRKHRE